MQNGPPSSFTPREIIFSPAVLFHFTEMSLPAACVVTPCGVLGGSPGEEFSLKVPRIAAVKRALAEPVERVPCNLGECPAGWRAAAIVAFLHDVATIRASDLARIGLHD